MVARKTTTKFAESKKKSEASKKGWITRRKNQSKQSSKNSSVKPSRTPASDKLRKLQKTEKIRNISRLKAQKKGRSLSSDKPKLNSKKPMRPARRASKKRVSVR